MFEMKIHETWAELIRYTGEEKQAEVPALWEGLPIREIAPYAFSGLSITHLSLSDSVRKIGRYAMYNCLELTDFGFTDGLADLGAGAFTGCHHIRHLSLSCEKGETSVLRDILLEVNEELTVDYRAVDGKALLLFPEFYEEGVENTPARIIEHHTHGSGMYYRNCFVNRRLNFQEYDRCFPYAIGQEREDVLIRLVVSRLRYPYRLDQEYRSIYEAFLKDHFDAALACYTKARDPQTTSFLMQQYRKKNECKVLDFSL